MYFVLQHIYCSHANLVQLRLINLATGKTWDFYLNPSTKEFTFPPDLISPFNMRYRLELRVLTTKGYNLFKTKEPMLKAYWESRC